MSKYIEGTRYIFLNEKLFIQWIFLENSLLVYLNDYKISINIK